MTEGNTMTYSFDARWQISDVLAPAFEGNVWGTKRFEDFCDFIWARKRFSQRPITLTATQIQYMIDQFHIEEQTRNWWKFWRPFDGFYNAATCCSVIFLLFCIVWAAF